MVGRVTLSYVINWSMSMFAMAELHSNQSKKKKNTLTRIHHGDVTLNQQCNILLPTQWVQHPLISEGSVLALRVFEIFQCVS